MRQIGNVVFDLGKVLLNFEPQEYLATLFNDEHLVGQLYKVVFGSPEWFMLDRGVITQEQAVERLSNQCPDLANEIQLVFAEWFSILTPIHSTVEVLRQLKRDGYKLYVISNFHEAAFSYVYRKYDWFSLFDGLVISYQIKALKPEPSIYRALLEKYDLVPEQSVFVDDSLANIEGARQLGMAGVHYQTAEEFRQELELILRSDFGDDDS